MASAGDWRLRCHQELKRHRPAAVLVYREGEDEPRRYVPSGGERGQWKRLTEAIPQGFTRLELVNRDGAVCYTVDGDEAEVSAAGVSTAKGGTPPAEVIERHLALMLRAQDVALARQQESVGKLLDAHETIVKTLTDRLTSLETLVSTVIQSAYEATLLAAESEARLNNDGDESRAKNWGLLDRLLTARGVLPPARPATRPKPAPNGEPAKPGGGAGVKPQ